LQCGEKPDWTRGGVWRSKEREGGKGTKKKKTHARKSAGMISGGGWAIKEKEMLKIRAGMIAGKRGPLPEISWLSEGRGRGGKRALVTIRRNMMPKRRKGGSRLWEPFR